MSVNILNLSIQLSYFRRLKDNTEWVDDDTRYEATLLYFKKLGESDV